MYVQSNIKIMSSLHRLRYLVHLPKILKRRVMLVLTTLVVLWLLVRWKTLCTNIESHQHLKTLCTQYSSGLSVGNLCPDLCQPEGVSSLTCHNSYDDKEVVFSGIMGNGSVDFKSVKQISSTESLHWLDSSSKVSTSEDDFSAMIRNIIKLKFNMSINDIDAKKMTYLQYEPRWLNRHVEMENVWSLIQNNEYLALSLYDKFEIFPKLLGSCGSVYAMQKVPSISGYQHLMTLYDSKEEWKKRVRIALMILDLLLRLEKGVPEPLLLCNIKMNNFGVTDDFKKVLYLNLDYVHPKSVVNRITSDGSECRQHSDCDFLSCRSFCNLITFKCQHGVANNNLQMVCERIFLGWVMSGRIMIPGLLLGPWTPRVLIELLELCANPASETGVPRASATKEVYKRLYNLLKHLK